MSGFELIDVWIRSLSWWGRVLVALGAFGSAVLVSQGAIALSLALNRRRERRGEAERKKVNALRAQFEETCWLSTIRCVGCSLAFPCNCDHPLCWCEKKPEPPVLCQSCGAHVPVAQWGQHQIDHWAGKRPVLGAVEAFERAMGPQKESESELANVTICECDAKDCKVTARVKHPFDVPKGWVRRQLVDTICSENFGEGDFSGNQQSLYCPEHVATLSPPLAPDVVARLEQRQRLAVVRSDAGSKPPADLGG